jgi:hypothetical protein
MTIAISASVWRIAHWKRPRRISATPNSANVLTARLMITLAVSSRRHGIPDSAIR